MSCRISGGLAVCASLWLAACGGLSDVGEQDNDDAPPTAEVVVLNQPFSRNSAGKVVTSVRSGTEVFLSGKDSDGVVAPVLKFDWQLLTQGGVAQQVKLVTRNASTVSFAAPNADTRLDFRLTVTDSNGQTAQQDVEVTVLAVPDNNQFLSYFDTSGGASRMIRLVPIVSSDVAKNVIGPDGVEVEVTVRRFVDYTQPFDDGTYLEVATDRVRGTWLATQGAGVACDDPRNPVLQIPKPAVDIDDILAKVDPSKPELEPNPALVDDYELKLQVSISVVNGSLPAGVTAGVCAPDVPEPVVQAVAKWGDGHAIQHAVQTGASGSMDIGFEQLLGEASDTLDTPESARIYYDTIDPDRKRATFLGWLRENGFVARDRTGFSWSDLAAASTAQAVYTNNFDLGFGRDMYARLNDCPGIAAPPIGQPINVQDVGKCDVAAVVVNYSSLEGATKKLEPVLAVAMEYTVTPNSNGRRIVQFYTFAPDLGTGEFKRVRSANLDGRGEKYMPQVCTVCHGGAPRDVNAAGRYGPDGDGDVLATFLPWDLDSFLFADPDGANSDKSYRDESQRSRYTRAAQSESLRKLNQLAYLTYHDATPTRANRFTLAKELVEGWYGRQEGNPVRAFANTTFNSQYVPKGWRPNGVDDVAGNDDDNPAAAESLYKDVFARNCRACHVAHVPSPQAAGSALEALTVGMQPFNTCDKVLTTDNGGAVIEPQRVGEAHQLPIGCYRQFLNAPGLPQRLATGVMPFARLTMDRLWAPGTVGQSLFDHLAAEYRLAQDDTKLAALTRPGVPTVDFSIIPDRPLPAEVDSWMKLDSSASTFANTRSWSLELCQNPASLQTYCRTQPPPASEQTDLVCASASEGIVGSTSTVASFSPGATGIYRIGLAVNGQAASTSKSLFVPDFVPCSPVSESDLGPATVGTPIPVTLDTLFGRGNGAAADHRLFVSAPATGSALNVTPAECVSASGCAVTAAVSVIPTGVGVAGATLVLRDADGDDSAPISVQATGNSSLTARFITSVYTSANDDLPVNLLELNSITDPNVRAVVMTRTCGDGSVRFACLNNAAINQNLSDAWATVTAATSSGFTYNPPRNFSTHSFTAGNARGTLGAGRFTETITYRLERIDNTNDFSVGSIEIPVNALTTFATAQSLFTSATCSGAGCHTGTAPQYGGFAYATWRNGNLINFATPRVNLETVSSSGFICYPSLACGGPHSGGNQSANVTVLRQWLQSGANNY